MATKSQITKQRNETMKRAACLATSVQVAVLVWSASILTAGWLGVIKNADTTFTAGIFTSILANFGVQARRNPDEELTEKTNTPPKTKPEPKPEPKQEPTAVIRSSKSQTQP